MYKKYESFSIIGLYFETIIKLGDFFFLKKLRTVTEMTPPLTLF